MVQWSRRFHETDRKQFFLSQTLQLSYEKSFFIRRKVSYGSRNQSVFRQGHVVSLNSYLQQVVTIQRQQKTFLNLPFTKCIADDPKYEEDYCILENFIKATCRQVRKKYVAVRTLILVKFIWPNLVWVLSKLCHASQKR